ncbi:MAG: heavy-metal-associated domain-containing protein [Bacillota bacterium]|jgi:Cd2+/Zn2+-exporting ATPase|nr:heavy-metal-associated domain-containing protein [Candidatus Fermentithermobacillaceae bacterium]HAF66439.1 heavy metal-binding protein [Clostridiales bacterium UBA9857]HOA71321.1 heavy-metal-associated domain-containing protein [Bacillota bacterium]HOP70971.1 heavy-metal-associated domain-containing protein [Bacillota bacterium]HPT35800.1 heavy-metal-associated domain-containing protein [Bacillota bacterium]
MKKLMIMLGNLNCPTCASKVETALARMDGIGSAKVSFGSGVLNIEYDESKVSEERIKQAINRFGVEVTGIFPGKQG